MPSEVTTTITTAEGVAAWECRIEPPSAEGMAYDLAATATGWFGAGLPITFISGRESSIDLTLHAAPGTRLRAEINVPVTRMGQCYCEFDAEGEVFGFGDELQACEVKRLPGGAVQLSIRFIPHASRVDVLILTVHADAQLQPGRRISVGPLRTGQAKERRPDRLHQTPHIHELQGVLFHLGSLRLLGNYLELGFEIFHPGATLTGLSISSPAALSAAQWFTMQPVQSPPEAPDLPGLVLARTNPQDPIASPTLLERLGPTAGGLGHRIAALYSEFQDIRVQTPAQSDAQLQQIELHATFDDGLRLDIPLSTVQQVPVHSGPELAAIVYHAPTIEAGRQGVLLEIGARGASSVASRAFFSSMYRYIGLDRWPGTNVDIAADAHAMSAVIEAGSVDIIYSHSVMEHLLSPIQCVIEANKVLRVGGLFTALVPCIWPLHAEPWDYWRMSVHAWRGLLNHLTGFEILSTSESGWASVVPNYGLAPSMSRMQKEPSPLYVGVVARKTHTVEGVSAPWSADLAVGRYDH
jgi:SAM-dependent methyltransferase